MCSVCSVLFVVRRAMFGVDWLCRAVCYVVFVVCCFLSVGVVCCVFVCLVIRVCCVFVVCCWLYVALAMSDRVFRTVATNIVKI